MHNRLKVRTSVELEAIKKKDEEVKATKYKSCMSQLLDMRQKNEYNETLLTLADEILHMNPDVSTVWNIRKEYLSKLTENIEKVIDANAIVDTELKLTEAGLRINPKSYCAWHHRCWVLNNFGNESHWNYELKICSKLLEDDDRNFHCWDYRKYIVERLQVALDKELDYSLQKISSNFSNYSAWHYRSKLISKVYYPYEQLFRSEIYQKEVNLMYKAVYTEPKDQSAWFYHNWLLGCILDRPRFIQAGYNRSTGLLWVVVLPLVNSKCIKGLGIKEWKHLNENKRSNIYIQKLKIPGEFSEFITLHNEEDEIVDSLTLSNEISFSKAADFGPTLNNQEKAGLQEQLSLCVTLSELEPDIKWPLLATVIISEKLKANRNTAELNRLKIFDEHRKNYYTDLITRIRIEDALLQITSWQDKFIAKNLELTALYHNYYFTLFREVDLSNNPLGSNVIRYLDGLLSCEVLLLSNCNITSIDEFPSLPNLKILDVSRNPIAFSQFPNGLLQCHLLTSVDFSRTDITFNDCQSAISDWPPHLKIVFGSL